MVTVNCKLQTNAAKNENNAIFTFAKQLVSDPLKLKAFANDKINVTKKQKFLGRVENIVRKGENVGYQHFLLFPQCFQKASFSELLKVGIVW